MGGGPDDKTQQPATAAEEDPSLVILESPTVARLYPDIPADPIPIDTNDNAHARILYTKADVYIHPTSDQAEDIPGHLSFIEKSPAEFLLAWTPDSPVVLPTTASSPEEQLSTSASSYVEVEANPEDEDELRGRQPGQHNLMGGSTVLISPPHSLPLPPASYTASLPFRSIYSIWVRSATPLTRGHSSLTVHVVGGATLPTFWFHSDVEGAPTAAEEAIAVLRGLVNVLKSDLDPTLYLINPTREDAAAHTLPEPIVDTPPSSSSSSSSAQQMAGVVLPTQRLFDPVQIDPLFAVVKEARWNILESFSKITRLSRSTAAQILDHPLARPLIPHLPPQLQKLSQSQHARAIMDDYDSARVYLAKWAAAAQRDSERSAPRDSALHRPRLHGPLGGREEETTVGWFEVVDTETPFLSHTRTTPMSAEEWTTFFDETGRLMLTEAEVRERIFQGGIEHDIRIEVWKFLLGVYPWNSDLEEREQVRKLKIEEYFSIKRKWFENSEVQSNPEFQDQKHRIDKDVHRTDRSISFFAGEDLPNPDPQAQFGTNSNLELLKDVLLTYNFYNTDLGYVQGMSDLLAPVFAVMTDEVMAFWAFVGYMDRMKSNFYTDQSGMHRQLTILDQLIRLMDPRLYAHLERTESFNLFFCFRWLLIWFKREFAWEDIMRLWEVLWSDHLTSEFHLFVALAILDKHRDVIMDHLTQFDEILKYINDLSRTIDLEETLQRAEILYLQFERRVETVDNRREELDEELSKRAVWTDEQKRKAIEEEKGKLPVIAEGLRGLLQKEEADKGKKPEMVEREGLRKRGTSS